MNGYPANFKIVTQSISPNVMLASSAFLRFNKFNFGNRMALFKFNKNIVVWSPLPYGPQVRATLSQFANSETEGGEYNITHVIVPNREHNLAAKSYKTEFPNVKIIAMENIPDMPTDYLFTSKLGNKVLKGDELASIVGGDEIIVNNFEFVYLPFHQNQELVMYEKSSKAVFEGDLLFNLGVPGLTSGKVTLEQFSPETGYPKGFNPHGGWSFMTRYMQPYSKVGGFLFRKLVNVDKSKPGLEAIYGWNFDKIVMCHGNVLTKDAKEAFKHVFL